MDSLRLTGEEAINIIDKACAFVKKYPSYRLGQSLWNELPKHIAQHDMKSNQDHYTFYNTKNVPYAIEYFVNNFILEDDKADIREYLIKQVK